MYQHIRIKLTIFCVLISIVSNELDSRSKQHLIDVHARKYYLLKIVSARVHATRPSYDKMVNSPLQTPCYTLIPRNFPGGRGLLLGLPFSAQPFAGAGTRSTGHASLRGASSTRHQSSEGIDSGTGTQHDASSTTPPRVTLQA